MDSSKLCTAAVGDVDLAVSLEDEGGESTEDEAAGMETDVVVVEDVDEGTAADAVTSNPTIRVSLVVHPAAGDLEKPCGLYHDFVGWRPEPHRQRLGDRTTSTNPSFLRQLYADLSQQLALHVRRKPSDFKIEKMFQARRCLALILPTRLDDSVAWDTVKRL